MRLHRRADARSWEAQSLHSLSSALWRRGGHGDRGEAQEYHARTIELATELGMAGVANAPWPPPDPVS